MIFAVLFLSFGQFAKAGTISFSRMSLRVQGRKVNVISSGCSLMISGDSDFTSGFTAVDKLPPPAVQTYELPDASALETHLDLRAAAIIEVIPSDRSRIEVSVVSDSDPQAALNKLKFRTEQRDQGPLLTLETAKEFPCVATTSDTGAILTLKGTCVSAKIYVAENDQYKIYRYGRFYAKSKAARYVIADIVNEAKSGSSPGAIDLLDSFIKESGPAFTAADILETVAAFSSPPQVESVVEKMAGSLNEKISGKALVALLQAASSPSFQVNVLQALVSNIDWSKVKLVDVLQSISSPPFQVRALEAVAGYQAALAGSVLVEVVSAITSPPYQVQALAALAKPLAELSGADLIRIVGAISSPPQQIQAIEAVKSKLSSISGGDLANLVGVISSPPFQAQAVEALAWRATLTASELDHVVGRISSPPFKRSAIQALQSRVTK